MIEGRGRIYDDKLNLQDAGAVTATTGVASDETIDLGKWTRVKGEVVVDVSAIAVDEDDELYVISVQASSSSTFASGIEEVACLRLGAKEVLAGDVDSTTGRYFIPFTNEKAGTKYRYLRLHATLSGTTPSINYTAFLTVDR